MFGPRRTFESVAKDLATGLENGTILLHSPEPTAADVRNFESMLKAKLARYRHIQIGLVIFVPLLVTATVLLSAILLPKELLPALLYGGDRAGIVYFFAGMLTGTLIGSLSAFTAHKRSVELKTFIEILRMADPATAKRLVLLEGHKLRARVLVP